MIDLQRPRPRRRPGARDHAAAAGPSATADRAGERRAWGRGLRDRHQGDRSVLSVLARRPSGGVRRRGRRQDHRADRVHPQRGRGPARRGGVRRHRRALARGARAVGGDEAARGARPHRDGVRADEGDRRARASWSGSRRSSVAEYFRDERGQGRDVRGRQPLPARAGGHGGQRAARPPAFARRLPADARGRPRGASKSASPRRATATWSRSRPSTSRPTTTATPPSPTRSGTWTARWCSSRDVAAEGYYPAVDPLASSSKALDPAIVGERHYDVAEEARRVLAPLEELRDIISMLGIDELAPEDRGARRARAAAPQLPDPAVLRDRGVHGHARPAREPVGHRRRGRGDPRRASATTCRRSSCS